MPRGQRGFTLAEVTVALALSAILLAVLVPFCTTALKAAAQEQRRLEAQQSARFALEAILREVRYAISLESAKSNDHELVFVNQQGDEVHFDAAAFRNSNPLVDTNKYDVTASYQYLSGFKGVTVTVTVTDKADRQASVSLTGTAVCLAALTN